MSHLLATIVYFVLFQLPGNYSDLITYKYARMGFDFEGASKFLRGKAERWSFNSEGVSCIAESEMKDIKEITGGIDLGNKIKWGEDGKFQVDEHYFDLEGAEGGKAQEALLEAVGEANIKAVADTLAAKAGTTPEAIKEAGAKKETSIANAENKMGDGPTEKDPVKKAWYDRFVVKLTLAAGVTIGALQLVAEGQKGCYLVDKDGIYRTKIPSLSGCSDASKGQCNCLNADVASACQVVCPGITGDCTEESAKKCLCPGWTIAHRCPEFWDVASSIAAEIGLIIDDVGNLVDSAAASGANFMKYFWWVLIGFAALVAIVLAVVLFRKLSGGGKSKE